MNPIAFEIDALHLQIHWYGICMALSMLVGAWWSSRLLKSHGRNGDAVWDGLFVIILSGIIGARVVYVLTNLSQYFGAQANPWDIFAVWKGGLSFHGGIIFGMLASWLFFRAQRIPFVEVMDAFAPGVSIGIILVRIGNFLNGDIEGYKWNGPWAMNFPYDILHFNDPSAIIPRHPTELYGMLVGVFCLVVSLVLWNETYRTKRFATGTTFFGFIITYSLVRSIIEEPFRAVPLPWQVVDPATAGYGLFTSTQLASILLILIAIWGLTQLRGWERQRSLAPASVASPKPEGGSRQVRRASTREKQKGK